MTQREHDRVKLSDRVLKSHGTSDGTYGSPRITADLRAQGILVTQKTVAKVMDELGIAGISPRSFVLETTVTKSRAAYPRDRVKRAFRPTRVNMIWTSDITYLHSSDGVAYKCAIRDEDSGRIVGWAVTDHMRDELVVMALKMAYVTRARRIRRIIFHTDRGSPFNSRTVRKQCRLMGLKLSMRQTGSCFDDTLIEEFSDDHYPDRPWGRGNSPMTAVREFVASHRSYEVSQRWARRGLLTEFRDGILHRID